MGGSQTRWTLLDSTAQLQAEGHTQGATALRLHESDSQTSLRHIFTEIAQTLPPSISTPSLWVCAGLTGLVGSEHQSLARDLIATIFKTDVKQVKVHNDIEIAYYSAFEAGEGYLIYAGTGSIGAYIDAQGQLHRVGGHGYILDDAGGGYWIAREALKHIWRQEDEQPGNWQTSALAQAVFAHIGGHDWQSSRQFLYQGSRGDVGRLAIAVAASADRDAQALAILHSAGKELARLAQLLCQRFGTKPLALAGRVRELHPMISDSFRQHLPAEARLHITANTAQHAAAQLALKDMQRI
ncbi:ATPase [Undibacterium sp. LX40W]|uniref:ATPase n=2 Tax=Oxalobacteraceae TaxID=75682 RepID=A0A923HM11_9BURK|nr:ATPase [Undibacterium nitidum]MBC3891701.1 ATPase [Undibacterium sp. LX40W]